MRTALGAIYGWLPYGGKVVAATIRGAQLDRWRYGRRTDELVRAAQARETWAVDEWRAWQDHRLAAVLDHARWSVPHYRRYWDARSRADATGAWRRLDEWPVLRKEQVREDPQAFLRDGVRRWRQFEDHTSGTTGTPLRLWFPRRAVQQWYALFEGRVRRWNGLHRGDRWAILGGQLVAPVSQRRPPYWVWNAAGRQLYLSVFHIGPDTASAYIEALRGHGVRYVLGYTSAVVSLAAAIDAAGLRPPALRVVITNGEPLHDRQRSRVKQVFGCPVRSTYGMAEAVAAGSECREGTVHAWPEVGIPEILDEAGAALAPGVAGRLVCTGLLNEDMPLVRYEVGDRAALSFPSARCACRRSLPAWSVIEGRSDDVVVTADGRRIGRLDGVFKADLSLQEAQIIQESLHRVRIRYVPDGPVDQATEHDMERRLRERVPGVHVTVEAVDSIERDRSGKFRAVISNVEG